MGGRAKDHSIGHAQGAKSLRKQDHSGLVDCYISRVKSFKFEVKKHVSKDDLAMLMPPRAVLSKLPL